MTSSILTADIAGRLADLYRRMEEAYDQVAAALAFSCQGCPDNCCDSFFLHHTSIEWAYLWQGIEGLSPEQRQTVLDRAARYVAESEAILGRGERPILMCPLNQDGLCMVYGHRLMICRMHGVPSLLRQPNGQTLRFPGCFRCQEIVAGRDDAPSVDRTPLLQELAALEMELLGSRRQHLPRVKMTIAQMLMQGPPRLD